MGTAAKLMRRNNISQCATSYCDVVGNRLGMLMPRPLGTLGSWGLCDLCLLKGRFMGAPPGQLAWHCA